jgi:hypothetical protein
MRNQADAACRKPNFPAGSPKTWNFLTTLRFLKAI